MFVRSSISICAPGSNGAEPIRLDERGADDAPTVAQPVGGDALGGGQLLT